MKISKISIFVNGNNDKKEIAEMILMLTRNRIQRNTIRLYDISEEEKIKLFFEQKQLKYPILFLWGNLYGNIEFVREENKNGRLALILMNNPNKKNKKKGGNKNNNDSFEFNPIIEKEIKKENKMKKDIKIKKETKNEVTKENEVKENVEIKKEEIVKEEIKENEKQNEVKEETKEIKKEEEIIELKKEDEVKEIKKEEEIIKEEINEKNENIKKVIEEELFEESLIKITESIEEKEDIEIMKDKKIILIEDYENKEEQEEEIKEEEEEFFELNEPLLDSLNIGDKWLNACEWAFRTITHPPLFINKEKEESLIMKKEEGDIDFYVTRTNWYWRHQIRIIRFSKSNFYRLDENHHLRETFRYEDVNEINQIDKNYLIIKFSSNVQPQYLQCKLIDQFISTLTSHLKEGEYKLIKTI